MTRFTDPLEWLFGLEQFGIKLGLENIGAILDALGHPERTFDSVHIAGTNGKGSVTAMVDAALGAAGHRSARYTSPHLLDVTERFVIGGAPVTTSDLAAALTDIRGVINRLQRDGSLTVQPTFFEVTTAAAFELFRRASVDVAVCEVGLGGRLDATNVLEPVAAAITSIGLDHQQHLGQTLAEIAREKAGIIKTGVPVVLGRMDPVSSSAIRDVASARGAPVLDACDGTDVTRLDTAAPELSVSQMPTRIRLRTPSRDYGDITLGLAGDHQIDNAIVAVRLLEVLHERQVAAPAAAIVEGLTRVRWPARLEYRRLADGREVLLDAAHNPDGAAALAAFLTSKSKTRRPLVFGAMRDKNSRDMLRALAPAISALIVTRASTPRSAEPFELAEQARDFAPGLTIVVHESPRDALGAAWRYSTSIVVAGSIFLLGDVLKELDRS